MDGQDHTLHPEGAAHSAEQPEPITTAELQALRASELGFRTLVDNSPFLALIKDADGRFLFYNQRFAEQFNLTPGQWIGAKHDDIWSPEIAAQFNRHDDAVRQSGTMQVMVEHAPGADGIDRAWRIWRFPWRTLSGEQLLGVFVVDATEEIAQTTELERANQQLALANRQLAEANARLEELATIDALTGLGNRRILDERAEYEFRLARRHKTPFSVVLLDLDDFKRRNDLYGHAAGDRVLKRVGELIRATLRATDTAARYGGEEFVILLPGAESWGAELFLARLVTAIANEPWPDEPLTGSFGIASLTETTRSAARLIEQADDAMYEAKRQGKNRTVTHKDWLSQTLAQLTSGPGDKT